MPPEPTSSAVLREAAPAKLNLSLRVLGRRPDGYHELESLVAFAAPPAADEVSLALADPEDGLPALEVAGPAATYLAGEATNLVLRAADAARRACPQLRLGTFRLAKHLPVAAGVGGGSADAAAALRLIRRANPELADKVDWRQVAASIGADVPVCLESRSSLMTGLGEQIEPLAGLPNMHVVLANPRLPLATSAVFAGLRAPMLSRSPARPAVPAFADQAALIEYLQGRPNDLEPTATGLCPEVAIVRTALHDLDGALLARMSGSGPTCFALFATENAAKAGATRLRAGHPHWWIAAGALV